MNDNQREAIIAEILAAYRDEQLQPWEFTTYDLMEREPGLTLSAAVASLKRREQRGELRSRLVRHRNHRVRAYWKPGDAPATE